MRCAVAVFFCLATSSAALADSAKVFGHRAGHPRSIGRWGDWRGATHEEGQTTVCYAFSRPTGSSPRVPGRGDVVLTVTRRPGHDVVALSAGFSLTGHEDAILQAGGTKLLFYIAGRSAFARDNQASIAAFGHETSLTAHLPGPRGIAVTDRFSLNGFLGAYQELARACPAP